MYRIAIVGIILLSGCSLKTFYPLGGAVVGGGVGAIGGPLTGAAGAGLGYSAGELAKGNEDLEEAKDTIKALSTGDVQALVDKELDKQKSSFDGIVDGIYRILWYLGIACALWFVLPMIWAKWHVDKTVKKHIDGKNKENP